MRMCTVGGGAMVRPCFLDWFSLHAPRAKVEGGEGDIGSSASAGGGVSGRQAGRVPCVPILEARCAPRQPADRPGGRAARPRAPSSPSIAVGQRACGRPRRGSVAAVLPHWSHDDTVACQMVGSHARGHNLPRATGARRGVNNGAAQRAGDGSRAYPAKRHCVCIRTRPCVRRLPILISIGAAFGGDPETGKLTGVLAGRGRVPCAVGRHLARASATPRQNTGRAQHHDGSTKKCPF